MRLKMVCFITHKQDESVVAFLDIYDVNGDEYMEPFIKVCLNRKEAIKELSAVLSKDSNHYLHSKMKFKRSNYYKLGEDEVFEYLGEI